MYDIAPKSVLDRIGAAYERAVKRAQLRYRNWSADEEYATGALGGTMEELVKGQAKFNGSIYRWTTTTWPIRGKGPNSPETEYGADAVIEIVLQDESGGKIASKIIPIQNKKERVYSNRILADQAKRLSKLPGGGLIVSFSERGLTSCEASVVAAADGKWTTIPDNQKSDLGHTLATKFLPCHIGSRDLVYEPRREVFRTADGQEIRLRVRRRIRTLIKKRS
jgi:hypothetical protein